MTDEIIALDVASVTGVAEGPASGAPRLYTVRFMRKHDDPEDAFGRAVLWIAERLVVSIPMCVYIEAPFVAGTTWGNTNARTSTVLTGLWAAVAGVCKARDVPVRRANVSSVRKWFLGQGNLPGDRAKCEALRVSRALGWAPANYDEADAAAIWHYAAGLHDKRVRAPAEHWTAREMA